MKVDITWRFGNRRWERRNVVITCELDRNTLREDFTIYAKPRGLGLGEGLVPTQGCFKTALIMLLLVGATIALAQQFYTLNFEYKL